MLLGAPAAANAAFVFTPPSSLAAGASYRLVFVSDLKTTATNSSISFYNNLVNTEAQANLGLPSTSWTAIASTALVSATSNTSCGTICDATVPIFLTDGVTEIALSTNSLFGGGILNIINETSAAQTAVSSYVWTGSTSLGVGPTGAQLGATGNVGTYGSDYYSSSEVLNYAQGSTTTSLPLYAISGVLTVSGVPSVPVPEPASAGILALGGLAAGLLRRRRKQG